MTALTVQNPESLISRTIDQATNKGLMLRELVQNSLEAVSKQTNGKKQIFIRSTDPSWFGLTNYSTKKLGIWNTGPGMDSTTLRKATDLASSIGKSQGLHGNFGIGAKVSALAVNQAGMIWVSCANKEVHMVVLRKHKNPLTGEPRYERQDFEDGNGGTTDVINITSLFNDQQTISDAFGNSNIINPSGLDADNDWTFIILCGNRRNQNTIENPYDEDKTITEGWVLNEIYKRFSNVPVDVELRSEFHGHTKASPDVEFKTVFDQIKDRANKFPNKVQYETVSTDEGIDITYVYDGPWGDSGDHNDRKPTTVRHNPAPCPLFSGIIFKDEIYDIRGGGYRNGGTKWQPAARECGIVYGYDYLRVFVHLPATENIVPDQYRIRLQWNTPGKEEIKFTDYRHSIYLQMPDWFKDKIQQFAPKSMEMDEVQKELQRIADSLNIMTSHSISSTAGGAGNSTTGKGSRGNGGGTASGKGSGGQNKGTRSTGLLQSLSGKQYTIVPPKVIVLRTKEEIKNTAVDQSTFEHRAAEYTYNDDNILFINGTYGAVESLRDHILGAYLCRIDSETITQYAEEVAINSISLLVGKAVVYSLGKKGKPGFTLDDFEKIIDSACLSIHADNWIEITDLAKKQLDKKVKMLDFESLLGTSTSERLENETA